MVCLSCIIYNRSKRKPMIKRIMLYTILLALSSCGIAQGDKNLQITPTNKSVVNGRNYIIVSSEKEALIDTLIEIPSSCELLDYYFDKSTVSYVLKRADGYSYGLFEYVDRKYKYDVSFLLPGGGVGIGVRVPGVEYDFVHGYELVDLKKVIVKRGSGEKVIDLEERIAKEKKRTK